MKFIEYTCEENEDVKALYREDTQDLIMYGDYYDDKIEKLIDGFLMGIKHMGGEYELVEMCINREHKMFKECFFHHYC